MKTSPLVKALLFLASAAIVGLIVVSQVPSGADQRDERAQRVIDSISAEYRALAAHDRQLVGVVRILRDSLKTAAAGTTKVKKVYDDIKKTPAIRYTDPQLDSVLSAIYPR